MVHPIYSYAWVTIGYWLGSMCQHRPQLLMAVSSARWAYSLCLPSSPQLATFSATAVWAAISSVTFSSMTRLSSGDRASSSNWRNLSRYRAIS